MCKEFWTDSIVIVKWIKMFKKIIIIAMIKTDTTDMFAVVY